MTATQLAESTTTQPQNIFHLDQSNPLLGYYRLIPRYLPQGGYGWAWGYVGHATHRESSPYSTRKEALAAAFVDATANITVPGARQRVRSQMSAELVTA